MVQRENVGVLLLGCRIAVERDFLHAELLHRETAEETRAFFRAITRENRIQRHSCLLLEFRSSRPFSFADQLELVELLIRLALDEPSHKIALVGDGDEISSSFVHVASLAQQRGHHVRSFKTTTLAVQWFMNRRNQEDRRNREHSQQMQAQRDRDNRRNIERRRLDLDDPQMA